MGSWLTSLTSTSFDTTCAGRNMCRLPAIASFCLSELRLRVNGFIGDQRWPHKWWQSRMVLSPVALYYMLVGKGRFKHISHIYIISLISANVFLIWVPAGLTKRTSQDSASGSRCQFRRVGVESGNSVLTCLVQWKVAVHISNGIVTFQILYSSIVSNEPWLWEKEFFTRTLFCLWTCHVVVIIPKSGHQLQWVCFFSCL